MEHGWKAVPKMFKQAFEDWLEDECPRMAAALSYYTVLSLPPLLLLLLTITGSFVDTAAMQERIRSQMATVIGSDGAAQVQTMIQNASAPGSDGLLVTLLSAAVLVFGATSVFAQLQGALNRAWEVEPDPERGGLRAMLRKRVLSLGMVLTIGFLLLVSMVLSAGLSAFGSGLVGWLPWGLSSTVLHWAEVGLSLLLFPVLFALIFMILPDAHVSLKDVIVGALATAILFIAGKELLGLYFGRANPGQAYGAAGSLVVVLVWVYFSAMIFLYGAELTQVWAVERGGGIRPEEGAVRMVREKHRVSGSSEASG